MMDKPKKISEEAIKKLPVQESSDSDIPDMPDWRKAPRKPLLEKSTRSLWDIRKERFARTLANFPLKKRLLLSFVALVLVSALALYFVFFYESGTEDKSAIVWRELPIAHFQQDRFAIMAGQKSAWQRLEELYLDSERPVAYRALRLEAEEPGQVASPQILKPKSTEIFYDDQIALLHLYLYQRDESGFKAGLASLKENFPDIFEEGKAGVFWPEILAYLRCLLLAEQCWPQGFYLERIKEEEASLYPAFAEGLKGRSEEFKELKNTQFYSNEQENYQTEVKARVIHLEKLDLWVLESLAQLESKWQEIFAYYLKLLSEAKLQNGFYAYAWDSENEIYIPSAGQSFKSDIKSSLRQLYYLSEVGKASLDDLKLYNTLCQRDGGFYQAYNSVSLSAWSASQEVESLLIYLAAAQQLDSSLAQQLAVDNLDKYLIKDQSSAAKDLLQHSLDTTSEFYFRENLAYLALQSATVKP